MDAEMDKLLYGAWPVLHVGCRYGMIFLSPGIQKWSRCMQRAGLAPEKKKEQESGTHSIWSVEEPMSFLRR